MSETIISAVFKFIGRLGRASWWRERLELGDIVGVFPHSRISVKLKLRNKADVAAAIHGAVVDFEGDEKRQARAWVLSKDQSKDWLPIGRSELIVDWEPSSGDGAVSGIRVTIEGVELAVSGEGIEKIRAEIAARK
ncbi:hypothetical protein [Wenzhouxiangella sediminis]|uniref:Uncharacterized protein n=1 Tax=Wenzhouxiangella sediminis TaxID=1792836 RepID=A0A3E1K5J6_9GAMM|nr:hypothetical protein [Wenzhouxiangella sediminis]RFF29228.1 hypothetical protein DZC52_14075 [Wenzhouxiangella sediminis]